MSDDDENVEEIDPISDYEPPPKVYICLEVIYRYAFFRLPEECRQEELSLQFLLRTRNLLKESSTMPEWDVRTDAIRCSLNEQSTTTEPMEWVFPLFIH